MTTCDCVLSGLGYGFFDAVDHYVGCALVVELEALVSGDLIPAHRVAPWAEWTYRDDRELVTEH
jgi:hypothetical protein